MSADDAPSRPRAAAGLFDGELRRRLATALPASRRTLLDSFDGGAFRGRLSSSALSTATAAIAWRLLAAAAPGSKNPEFLARAGRAERWLEANQNKDGGFGDTTDSPSNISTTVLAWVALGLADGADAARGRADAWLDRAVSGISPERLKRAVAARYGEDLTFSVPILTAAALGGRLGEPRAAFCGVPHLPFELAAFPRRWFRLLGIPMVSYALPALIALGQVRHALAPARNPLVRAARSLARARTLRLLQEIQPSSGGFLEAAPLTSFVLMSLAAMGLFDHPVARGCAAFLERSQRGDGSLPIDTNLDTWTTTLAVKALAAGGRLEETLDQDRRRSVARFLLDQQYTSEHPYTLAPPGGFAWTDLPGGVPDADDTPGAMLALFHLGDGEGAGLSDRMALAARWLLGLQNRDGGIPTFCRGFGRLPFDRSAPDLTAHALRALWAWRPRLPRLRDPIDRAALRATAYLERTQRPDGAFVPLWFGNQREPREENPLYGTSQVLLAAAATGGERAASIARRACEWLLRAQAHDGSFGAGPGVPPSIEETALAVDALAAAHGRPAVAAMRPRIALALARGLKALLDLTADGNRFPAAPIGLYFAKLWYSERLYPVVFTVSALERSNAIAPPSA